MIEDIMKLIEMFYIAFMFVYNQMYLLNFDMSDSESSDSGSETLSDITDNTIISFDEDMTVIEYIGSQQNYRTRILKTMKTICNYDTNMTVLLCHMLTNETNLDNQRSLRQLFTGVDSTITQEEIIVPLKEDIDVRIEILTEEKDKTKKNTFVRTIKMNIESIVSSKEEIEECLREIKKPYVKVNGNVKPKFIFEMYLHYFNEPCFLENSQIMKIQRTVHDVINSYNTSSRDPERFLKSLLV